MIYLFREELSDSDNQNKVETFNKANEVQNNSLYLEENFLLNFDPQNSQNSQPENTQVGKQEISKALETYTSKCSFDIVIT